LRTEKAAKTSRNQRKVRALEKAGRRKQTIFHQEIQRSITNDLIFLNIRIYKVMTMKKIRSLKKESRNLRQS